MVLPNYTFCNRRNFRYIIITLSKINDTTKAYATRIYNNTVRYATAYHKYKRKSENANYK